MAGAGQQHRGATAVTRRRAIATGLALAAGGVMSTSRARRVIAAQSPEPDEIVALAQDALTTKALKAVILRVTIDGEDVVTRALGESMAGVPATPQMHFRNAALLAPDEAPDPTR